MCHPSQIQLLFSPIKFRTSTISPLPNLSQACLRTLVIIFPSSSTLLFFKLLPLPSITHRRAVSPSPIASSLVSSSTIIIIIKLAVAIEAVFCPSLPHFSQLMDEIVELHDFDLVLLLYFTSDASASGSVSVDASGRSCDRLCIHLRRRVSIGLVTSRGRIKKE